jgi:hypothetical protein
MDCGPIVLGRGTLAAALDLASRHATAHLVVEGLSRPALEVRRPDGSREVCYLGDTLSARDGRLRVSR